MVYIVATNLIHWPWHRETRANIHMLVLAHINSLRVHTLPSLISHVPHGRLGRASQRCDCERLKSGPVYGPVTQWFCSFLQMSLLGNHE